MADGFPDDVKEAAFRRANGRCEKCNVVLSWATAQFHHIKSKLAGGSDTLANCQVLCKPCHEATLSYGRH